MKKIIRVLALICTLLIACTTLQGCSKKDSSGTEEKIVDLEGYVFEVASSWLVDDTSGAALAGWEKYFHARRAEIENDYNCTIKIVSPDNADARFMAGEKVCDWFESTPYVFANYVAKGYLKSYDDVEGIDIKNPAWSSSITDTFRVNGKAYGIQCMKPTEVRSALFYNKDLLKACGVEEDLVELVKNKQWTFDKFREILQKCTDEGKKQYGLMNYDWYESFAAFIAANGGKIADIKDGKVVEGTTSKNVLNALNYYDSLCNEYKVVMINEKQRAAATFGSYAPAQAQLIQYFINNKVAFYFADAWVINQLVKPQEPEFEYGMVPMPMGPDATEYTSISSGLRAFGLSANLTDEQLEKAKVIINAFAIAPEGYEGEEWVNESITSDYLQPGDEGSVEMYKLCQNSTVYDMARTAGTDDLWGEFVLTCGLKPILFRDTTISSALEAFNGIPTNRLNSLFKFK